MKFFRLLLLSALLVLTSQPAFAQKKKKREKETNKVTPEDGAAKEAKALEQKQAEYAGRKDHHMKVQDKATRKRMKKNLKKAERHSWGKDVPWYKRWFRKSKF